MKTGKTLKAIIAIALIFALAFVFAGCGDDEVSEDPRKPPDNLAPPVVPSSNPGGNGNA